MNIEEKEELIKRENRGYVFLRSQWDITGASPHAERMCYAEEYLISTFLRLALSMKNAGILNDKTLCLFLICETIKNDCGSGKFWTKGKLPVRMWKVWRIRRSLQDERHCYIGVKVTLQMLRSGIHHQCVTDLLGFVLLQLLAPLYL